MLADDALASAGSGDNMMRASGSGNIRTGVVTVSLGTSGMICAFSEQPVVDSKGEIAGFCDGADHWLPLSCTMNVAVVTDRCGSSRLGHPDDGGTRRLPIRSRVRARPVVL